MGGVKWEANVMNAATTREVRTRVAMNGKITRTRAGPAYASIFFCSLFVKNIVDLPEGYIFPLVHFSSFQQLHNLVKVPTSLYGLLHFCAEEQGHCQVQHARN